MRNASPKTTPPLASQGAAASDPTGLKSLHPPAGYTGRKPLPHGRARTSVLSIKVSILERHQLEQRALDAGMRLTSFVRQAALGVQVTRAASIADMTHIAQLNDIALVIAAEAAKLGRGERLPAEALAAFTAVTDLSDRLMAQLDAADNAQAAQQRLAAELAHVGRNLNQITRAVNTIAKRRDGDTALPPYTRGVLADIAALMARLPSPEEPGP